MKGSVPAFRLPSNPGNTCEVIVCESSVFIVFLKAISDFFLTYSLESFKQAIIFGIILVLMNW